MKLEKIEAENFKIFDYLILPFNGKSTILFGVNGTGKSSVLEIINYLFHIWINRINALQGKAYHSFGDEEVRMGEYSCNLQADIRMDEMSFLLSRNYAKTRGRKIKGQSGYDRKQYQIFCDHFTSVYLDQEKNAMPVFVNYGTNRSVLDIPLRIRNKHDFQKISALDHAVENDLDFRAFFEWFRNQEDYENEIRLEKGDKEYEDILLKCVRFAIESMLDHVSGLRVRRNPLSMWVKKGDQDIRVDLLSDGEKCTMALLGDLARRVAMANQYSEEPLHGSGIVLIDEIELHMHPSWQRRIIKVLKEVFPNIQFIITTHSPQVLGEIDDTYQVFLLDGKDKSCKICQMGRMDGLDSNYILEEYMLTDSKNTDTKKLILDIHRLIADKHYEEAEKKLMVLKERSGTNDREFILAEGFLRRSRWSDDQNQ